MKFCLVRSKRRTLALQVKPDGSLVVRAPHAARVSAIDEFVRKNGDWIRKTSQAVCERAKLRPPKLLPHIERGYKEKAFSIFHERCRLYSVRIGVSYKNLALSNAKGRWGSCSAMGRLRLNWRLVMAPLEVIDYVIVHELAHLKELNHSQRFWAVVETALPSYRREKKWLKENALLLHF